MPTTIRQSRIPPHARRRGRVLGLLLMMLLGSGAARSEPVEYYVVSFGICDEPHLAHPTMILRSFQQAATEYYLAVDMIDLTTRIIPQASSRRIDTTLSALATAFGGLPYFKALQRGPRQCCPPDGGDLPCTLSHGRTAALTIDLCASHRPLDREFFVDLLASLGPAQKPFSLAIAASGLWLAEHRNDARWLSDLQRKNELAITWINHTHSHRLARDLPVAENFLLQKGTNLDYEVLQSEITMISQGLTPSVFFRFPGVVSDTALFGRISGLGLIPVGSDAYLAGNPWPADNGVVLLPSGGGEAIGARQFLALVKQKRDSLESRPWLMYDLGQSGTSSRSGAPAPR